MTSEKIRDTKLRALIKAFLVFHKGKKFTAKVPEEFESVFREDRRHS